MRNSFKMRACSMFAATALATVSMAMLPACTTTANSITVNTAELEADASALAFAGQALVTVAGGHLTADQQNQVNIILTQIKNDAAQINAASGGSISIDIGKDWAKKIGDEFKQLATIIGPIVATAIPSASGYIATAEQIIAILDSAYDIGASAVTVTPVTTGVLRARLFRGV